MKLFHLGLLLALIGCASAHRTVSSANSGCMRNEDCEKEEVCASIRGNYPGVCAFEN